MLLMSSAFGIPRVPDLQCSWQLLVQSAGPRANHVIQTLPPELSECALAFLGQMSGQNKLDRAKIVASLPMRMGGLGLRSASRCARAVHNRQRGGGEFERGHPRMFTHDMDLATFLDGGGLRSLRTGSHCGEERNWQWTPQWCPICA